jgi:hypothetical protein
MAGPARLSVNRQDRSGKKIHAAYQPLSGHEQEEWLQGLKPRFSSELDGGAEAPPFRPAIYETDGGRLRRSGG